jgi:hypothetical protein
MEINMELLSWFMVLLIIAMIPAAIAHSKGRSFMGWWLYGMALWIIALPHSIMAKNLKEARAEAQRQQDYKAQIDSSKTCPKCAETVKRAALVCRFCGYEFTSIHSVIDEMEAAGCSSDSLKVASGDLLERLKLLLAEYGISVGHEGDKLALKTDAGWMPLVGSDVELVACIRSAVK